MILENMQIKYLLHGQHHYIPEFRVYILYVLRKNIIFSDDFKNIAWVTKTSRFTTKTTVIYCVYVYKFLGM